MKTTLNFALTISLAAGLLFGCVTSVPVAVNTANGAAITTVDAAMKAWAAYTQAGLATSNQIVAVSNSYNLYYNSEYVLKSALITVAQSTNGTTIDTTALQAIVTVASQSETNIINIINQLTGATK